MVAFFVSEISAKVVFVLNNHSMILETGTTLKGSVAVRGNWGRMRNPYVLLDIPNLKYAAELPADEADGLVIGQEIEVRLLHIDDEEGLAYVSRDQLLEDQAWADVALDVEAGSVLSFCPKEITRGGIIGKINDHLEAFLPASKTNVGKLYELSRLLDEKEIEVVALEAERDRGNVLVSMNAALEKRQEEVLRGYKAGEIYELPVSGVSDFGLFLDLDEQGSITGLLHASELSHRVGNHSPRDWAKVGDKLRVRLMKMGKGKKGLRISFSLRRVQDPWIEASSVISPGDEVEGRVANVREDLGSFVSLAGFPRVVGYLRGQQLKKGQSVSVRVETFDPKKQKARLSLVSSS